MSEGRKDTGSKPKRKSIVAAIKACLRRNQTDDDEAQLRSALSRGRIKLDSGDGSVFVGRDATGAKILTGNGNVLLTLNDVQAGSIRALFEQLHPQRLYQLPVDVRDFKGRRIEEAKLLQHLSRESGGLVAIEGMGGIGKTALAVRVAHQLVERYPHAQLFIDLKGVSESPLTPEDALREFLRSFRPAAQLPESLEELSKHYNSELSQRRVLVVLDNAWNAEQVRPLLPPRPSIAIVTSRRAVSLPGVQLDRLEGSAAIALLTEVMGERRATSEEELNRLCEACSGHPLALRAAGSFLAAHRNWSFEEYLAALGDWRQRITMLKGPDDLMLDVHAILALSLVELRREQPELAEAWTHLALFPASFDEAGAAAIWQQDAGVAKGMLSDLLRRYMLEYDPQNRRYKLHDLMRDVANQFTETGDYNEKLLKAQTRYALHYVGLLRKADELLVRGGKRFLEGLSLYDGEADNIRAARTWIMLRVMMSRRPESCRLPELANIGNPGLNVLTLRLHPRQLIRWLQAVRQNARNERRHRTEVRCLESIAGAHLQLREMETAIAIANEAKNRARQTGDQLSVAGSLNCLGVIHRRLDNPKKAIGYYAEALEIPLKPCERRIVGNIQSNLGDAYFSLGLDEDARRSFKEALASAEEYGDRRLEANVYHSLGTLCAFEGDKATAESHYKRARAMMKKIGNQAGESRLLHDMGQYYKKLNKTNLANSYFEEAREKAREIDYYEVEDRALEALGIADWEETR